MSHDPRRPVRHERVAYRSHYGGAMRSLGLSLIALTSIVGCTETGAHLTLETSPDGPTTATSFRVVLAAYDQFPEVRSQRVAPGDRTTVPVTYFLQQTVAGGESQDIEKLDGFTVRIAPDNDIDETRYIPFLVLYDGDKIAGIATYRLLVDTVMVPSPILVMTDEIDKYVLTVEKATQQDDPTVALGAGEARVVTCTHDDGTEYESGIVWRASDGEEYRILLPNDGSLDATGRPLDMDCDDHAVTAETSHEDCDDTRDVYYRGAADTCDGLDTNCDGATTWAESCPFSTTGNICNSPFGITGVRLCDEATQQMTDCAATAYCGCNVSGGCHACIVPFEPSLVDPLDDSFQHPCQPIVGAYPTPRCSVDKPCDIEILAVRGEWKVKISPPTTNQWGSRATGITGTLAIKVEHSDPDHEEQYDVNNPFANRPLAEVDVAYTTSTGTYYEPLLIRLAETQSQTCSGAMMYCY